MALCDPYNSGYDICWRVGGDSTEQHTKCYTALDDQDDYGLRELYGCDLGCVPCKDYPSEMVRHVTHEGGRRFLRPDITGKHRDAWGNIHDLMSGEAWPIPVDGVDYQRGQCYSQARGGPRNSGEECFGIVPCRCWQGASIFPTSQTGRCNDVEQFNDVIESNRFYDALFFNGWDWPLWAIEGGIHCRKFEEFSAKHVPANPNPLLGMPLPVLLRYNQYASDVSPTACAPNGFIPCLGTPRDTSACLGYYRNDPRWFEQQLEPPDKWLDDQNQFNYLEFVENTAHFVPTTLSKPIDRATIRIKNLIMNHVNNATFIVPPYGSPVRFDRVEHNRGLLGGVAVWSRGYNRGWEHGGHNCGQLFYDPATHVATFPHCRTAEGGDQVTMNLYILSARYTVLLVTQKYWLNEHIGNYLIDRVEYHARIQFSIECAWIGSSPTARIVHDQNCFVLPKVQGDRIIYRDNEGRIFSPVQRAIWLGYLGRLGVGGTDRLPIWLGATIESHCNTIANGVNHNPIRGWPVLGLNVPNRPSGHYGGQVIVEFRQ